MQHVTVEYPSVGMDVQTDSLSFSTIKIKALQLVGSCKIIKTNNKRPAHCGHVRTTGSPNWQYGYQNISLTV